MKNKLISLLVLLTFVCGAMGAGTPKRNGKPLPIGSQPPGSTLLKREYPQIKNFVPSSIINENGTNIYHLSVCEATCTNTGVQEREGTPYATLECSSSISFKLPKLETGVYSITANIFVFQPGPVTNLNNISILSVDVDKKILKPKFTLIVPPGTDNYRTYSDKIFLGKTGLNVLSKQITISMSRADYARYLGLKIMIKSIDLIKN